MIKISMSWVIELVERVNLAKEISIDKDALDSRLLLLDLQSRILALFNESIYTPFLRTSLEQARSFNSALSEVLEKEEIREPFTELEIAQIKFQANEFKIILLAELTALPIFLVDAKDNFDVRLLIENGLGLFPKDLLDKAPETENDAMEAGKALAFEIPTACGFHTFRVVESVVRRYWDAVSKIDRPKLQTLGNFAAEMEKNGFGDNKIIESIKQMTKLHRNPLIHPDVILTVEEAIGILGMARSVISPMLGVLPTIRPTTGAP